MKLFVKFTINIFASITLFLIVLPLLISLLLQWPLIQNIAVDYITKIASKHLDAHVEVDRVDIKLFYNATLEGVYVEDPIERDTLIYIEKLEAQIKNSSLFGGTLRFGKVALDRGVLALNTDEDNTLNLKYIALKLKSDKEKAKRNFEMMIDDISIDSMRFEFRRHLHRDVSYGLNPEDMHFSELSIHAKDFYIFVDSISVELKRLSFIDKSKTKVSELKAKSIRLSPNNMIFHDAYVAIAGSSIDINYASLKYSMWDMSDFVNRVVLEADIESSQINFSTVERFTRARRHWDLPLDLKGNFKGTINNMSGYITSAKTLDTEFDNIDFTIKGLPNIQKTNFKVEIGHFSTTADDASVIYNNFTGRELNSVKRALGNMGRMKFKGSFDGLFSSFTSSGELTTNQGKVDMNLSMRPQAKGYSIDGAISTPEMALGEIIGVEKIGSLTFDAKVSGRIDSEDIKMDTHANIAKFEYNGYPYGQITAEGDLVNKTFSGVVTSIDENFNFNFNGLIDLTQEVPSYDFDLIVNSANLVETNFNHRDSVSLLSGKLKAHGKGSDIDNLNADISLDDLKYINHLDTVLAEVITIETKNNPENKFIKLNSQFADIEIHGRHSYKNIISYFTSTVKKYLPSLQEQDIRDIVNVNRVSPPKADSLSRLEVDLIDDYYIATVDVKQANNFASIFYPGLTVAQGTHLSFLFNPSANQFSLGLNSSEITKGDTKLVNINVDSRNHTDSISVFARFGEVFVDRIYIPDLSIIGSVKNNTIDLYSRFRNITDGSAGFLNSQSVIKRDSTGSPVMDINIKPSYFTLGKKMWRTNNNHILINRGAIKVDNVVVRADSLNESIALDGVISKNVEDTIKLRLNNIDLSAVDAFTEPMGFNIKGELDGSLSVARAKEFPIILTDMTLAGVMVNHHDLGDSFINSYVDGDILKFNLHNSNDTLMSGEYYRLSDEVFMRSDIEDIDIAMVAPFMSSIGDNVTGRGDISITADNLSGKLALDGQVKIKDMGVRLLFTNTRYRASAIVDVEKNQFTMRDGIVTDEMGVTAPIEAYLTNTNFKNVRYNISLSPEKMLCLNTTEKDNDLFYGHMYASGSVDVIGRGRNVVMNIRAKTENNSSFFMPLSDKSTISDVDFIKFATPEGQSSTVKHNFIINDKVKLDKRSSLDINMNVDVTTSTEVQIIIDPEVGDAVKGRGNGSFAMNVRPAEGIFTMNGGFEISQGSYLFTLRDIINKYFTIQPGSTISWTGDPLDANLAITATYQVKASLAPLLGDDSNYAGRVAVDCNLNLAGKLTKPDISLGITVPNVDPETQSLINATLNTEEAVSMQLFWLLFANTFYDDSSSSSSNVNIGLMSSAVTGIEFLSNQISNWLSSDKFDFGINYRPSTDMTSDEVELSVSAPILNNKLYIDVEGNYNAKNNSVTEALNTIYGDFYLTWILDNTANIRAKAFSRTITTFDENQGLQENGVGIYYKDDFNTFTDLIERYRKALADRKKRRLTIKTEKETIIAVEGKEGYKEYKKEKREEKRKEREEQQ